MKPFLFISFLAIFVLVVFLWPTTKRGGRNLCSAEPISKVLSDEESVAKALSGASLLFDQANTNTIFVFRRDGLISVEQTFSKQDSTGSCENQEKTTVWMDEITGDFVTPPGIRSLTHEEVISILKEFNPFLKASIEQNPIQIQYLGGTIVVTIGGITTPPQKGFHTIESPFVYRVRINEMTQKVILWEVGN